jgi:hypothetical protein
VTALKTYALPLGFLAGVLHHRVGFEFDVESCPFTRSTRRMYSLWTVSVLRALVSGRIAGREAVSFLESR